MLFPCVRYPVMSVSSSVPRFYPRFKNILSQNFFKNNPLPCKISQRAFQASLAAAATEEPRKANVKPISEMPSIKSYPLVGSTFSLITRKEFYQNKMHLIWEDFVKKLGPIITMTFPGLPPVVMVTHPDDIEKLYRETMNNPIRFSFHSLKKVRLEEAYFEKKGGILIENNEEWWRVRSRVQTPMLKPRNIHHYVPQMDSVALDFMDRISHLQKEHGEMPSGFQEELYKWALESVGLVALNRRLGCFRPNLSSDSVPMKMIETVNILFQCLNDLEMKFQWWRLFPTTTYKKLKEGHELFLKIAVESIKETEIELTERYSKEGDDGRELALLEILLQTEGLMRKDVVTFILDMLLAGIDTTSHAIGFTLYLLSRNPRAQKRLQEEVDSVLGDGDAPMNENHLARLSYLKACVKESLRIFPIVFGATRILTEDAVLGGYLIPKGYQIFTLTTVAAKDEAFFQRPLEYLPERWARDKPFGAIHPYASLPFSHGSRMCIGRRISEQEMYIFLARVMHRFNVDYKYKDIELVTRLVSVPSEPLKFQFLERK